MHELKIEQRRQKVASLVARSLTEDEIAQQLDVSQTTISRDIAALRELSRDFVYSLAKGDLGYCYQQCLTGINEAKKEAWQIADKFANNAAEGGDSAVEDNKVRLAALKVVIQAEVEKFKLLQEGPNILAVNKLSERMNQIEQSFQEANR